MPVAGANDEARRIDRGRARSARIDGDVDVEITGLSYDSRQTRPGDLFFSTARDAKQNRANIDDALNRGARAGGG